MSRTCVVRLPGGNNLFLPQLLCSSRTDTTANLEMLGFDSLARTEVELYHSRVDFDSHRKPRTYSPFPPTSSVVNQYYVNKSSLMEDFHSHRRAKAGQRDDMHLSFVGNLCHGCRFWLAHLPACCAFHPSIYNHYDPTIDRIDATASYQTYSPPCTSKLHSTSIYNFWVLSFWLHLIMGEP